MKIIIFLLLSFTTAFGQFSSMAPLETQRKNPVRFTHVPIILLRINPSQLFAYNNTLQYGVEIAPPIGKLSFAFDYGSGKGKSNFNKQVKNLQPDNKNREFRGEIRAYFSDWYPFYALDKKPFGRYYALEYVNGSYDRNLGINTVGVVNTGPEELNWITKATTEKTHVVHLKFGRHIHLHKHLFLDVYGGLGAGRSTITGKDFDIPAGFLYNPVQLNFLSNKMYESPKTEKYFFSKTFGVRIVVPI
jgi:hypothetical protein